MTAEEEFERCRPWLEAALEYANDTHTIDDIKSGVITGRYQFWPADKAAMITEVQEYPQRRVFNVFLGGGDMGQLLDMIDAVEVYAKTIGCKSITVCGRKGWIKVLESRGARPLYTAVAKELD